jgi:hypothetical protein
MKTRFAISLGLLLALAPDARAQLPVLTRSDVVFMYQTDRQTYADYGATVLAWGGRPAPEALQEAGPVRFFGSVGMVTEFNRYHDRFPETYEQGLCRNLDGQPFKVPWLTDHQHNGVPYWWCCTRQPLFRQYLSERVADTVKAGASGVHIDDHLGTAGSLYSGGCYCDRCVAEFPDYLKTLPLEERSGLGLAELAGFDYRKVLREWVAAQPGRKAQEHPLWSQWRVYQFRGAARFMEELRALAAATAGKPVPMGANACLLWGPHLSDYQALDLFSAEIEHHAPARRFSDNPLVAYRLADAVGRPLASTGSGGDWAFIKEQNLPGLVQGWVAFSYAAGHCLMVPHRQWCYTPQKGTHWYTGPREKFAPLFRFVRQNAALFDSYTNLADLTVVLAQRTFDRNAAKVMSVCNRLAATNLSYRIALGGDEIVAHPLSEEDLGRTERLLVLEAKDFMPADRQRLATLKPQRGLADVEQALAQVTPAVRVSSPGAVRVLPRVKTGSAVIHLVNWTYDASQDAVQPMTNIRLQLDLAGLGVAGAKEARVYAPGIEAQRVPVQQGSVTIPEMALWVIVELRGN